MIEGPGDPRGARAWGIGQRLVNLSGTGDPDQACIFVLRPAVFRLSSGKGHFYTDKVERIGGIGYL